MAATTLDMDKETTMVGIVKQFKMALVTITAGVILAGAYSAFTSTSARAQNNGVPAATHFKSMGPIKLNGNETALIGVLLPAVQSVAQEARLELFDSAGKMLVDTQVAFGDGSVHSTFYNIEMSNGAVRILDNAGNNLVTVRNSDGIVTGVLLPAVQRGGQPVEPLAASVQIIGADGTRGQYAAFCDGSVRF
jgi:hypothetical protein